MTLRPPSNRQWLIVLILAFLVLATTYSFVTPPFETPDEVGHFSFIVHILTTHSLPAQSIGELGEAHQPPLYYAVAALLAAPADMQDQTGVFKPNPDFIWAGRGGTDPNAGLHGSAETFPFRGHSLALHLARLSSVLMGALTVAFTVLIAWQVFPNQPKLGLLAGALVAFNPQFLFVSGSVNNDNLLMLLATIGWWQLLRALACPEQRRQWAYVGALIGAAFLAKTGGGLVLGLVAGITLLISAFKRRSLKLLVNGAWIMAVVAALVSGWWFVRNQLLYGDFLGWGVYEQVYAVNLRDSALRLADLEDFFTVQFRSFWGVFGWMTVPSPN
jgi:4-amino-4-deoxy-L-arabinose transferase-like glycosyltransferase